jgi:hypothetical protein
LHEFGELIISYNTHVILIMVRFLRLKLITFLISIILLNETESSKLVFLLVDGFRWDYFKLPGLNLNGFTRLFEHGTRAEWTVPAFPTNSFPNYKTLETGMLYINSFTRSSSLSITFILHSYLKGI